MAAPRLLDKKTIHAEVAGAKKAQIDQGVAIAKKVDALRETHAEEEKKLELLRVVTTRRIKDEIDGLIKIKDGLQDELEVLRQQRQEALQPFDALQRDIETRKGVIEAKEQELWTKQAQIDSKLAELAKDKANIENELARTETLKKQAGDYLETAACELNNARIAAQGVQLESNKILNDALLRDKNLTEREESVTFRENQVQLKVSNTQKKEEDLILRELQLQEGWKNLQKTAERVKQGRF